ncbi:HlyD family efflux transporter periplasmic adaptor subunit [Cyanobacterium aponinum UTEX 3222]|uniref:HlyD family efflux transporter periplasmic adaptor subunit n=1 Tax=Cyanobacterium aponinum AL20115 TaxID=3090662 RepID=A0AAF0ZAR0_9CHRO|nr:HlyD family efflux transporter periplasmic adaptor subunit [Cyanobacterium aponinum]MBD2395211.1 HlyD family efflux transporter periplasmic adaptor subunit [Cyanobacterium aponinum FACHB-4101]PHV62895.1 hemolysin secretion protein D [Cyanobacterium aponinum IPPAS B-1201]WPF88488.1 HlyD family efflux transporter periplasmic adaptor subunit [Cyanobacterium aponinum AL20115]WRL42661.1 HlyD family efflux transporter periplasmic adaptor subunit [Cyanobacterium aponinum UTEX 3222]
MAESKYNGRQYQANNANDTLLTTPSTENNSSNGTAEGSIDLDTSNFEKDVILKPSPVWSRATIWSIVGVTTFAVVWASVAKIEQVVTAQGQLKPRQTVKEIQAPLNGVVKEVKVEDGDRIQKGESLLVFDSQASQAELESLEKIRNSLIQENKFYRTLFNAPLSPNIVEQEVIRLKLPPEISALALNRTALVTENQLYQMQLSEDSNIASLKPDQLARLQAAFAELDSRSRAAELEIEQLEKQLNQNQVQIEDAKKQLANDRRVLQEIEQRNRESIAQAEESLRIDREILESILPLSEEGALATIQIERQKQQVQDRQRDLVDRRSNGIIELENQKQQVQTRLAEIQQLEEEKSRLLLDINQAQQEFQNTIAITEKDVRDRIAENKKRIAEIDSQINKVVVDNEKRIAELNSQISAAQQTIKYQELKAPVSGEVFDLQASPGFVPKSGQAEALLKIVPDPGPDNPLVAEVYVTNQDIGFVQPGQEADVRIDSFPYSEFGDIKGKVYFVASDALEPDQIYNFYRFPVKVELDAQNLMIRGEEVDLQSGMSVSVNIKVRENRTVLSLFTELFTKKVESLKQVR